MTKTSKKAVSRRPPRRIFDRYSDDSRKTTASSANDDIGSEATTKSLKKMRRRYDNALKRLAK